MSRSVATAPPLQQLDSSTLFLTNLRLLDLDLRDDWPGISVHTLATKDAQQNQKQRIRCVEWALYRLLEIWDPDETRDKLQPFFPPLEPLQSLNLRAALYRCLNDLKKNGALGRETVLRKTMLDECKGDKFLDILVVFSTLVLRKALSAPRPKRSAAPIARRYATAASLSSDGQASLLPLAIAHKAALTNVLRRKEERREKYREFGELLDLKSHDAVRRNEQCGQVLESIEQSQKALADAVSIKRILHENWLGNPEWVDVMVHGDQSEAEEDMFQMQFEEIWSNVQHGRPMEEHTRQKSLLQDLEARVKGQEESLSRWKEFYAKMNKAEASRSPRSPPADPKPRHTAVSLRFDAHQDLRIGRPGASHEEDRSRQSSLSQGYDSILANMQEALSAASKVKSSRPAPPRGSDKPKSLSAGIPTKPLMQRSAFVSKCRAKPEPEMPSSPELETPASPAFERPVSPDWLSPLGKPQEASLPDEAPDQMASSPPLEPEARITDDERDMPHYLSDREEQEDLPHVSQPPLRPNYASRAYSAAHHSPSLSSSPLNAEERLAEQILTSVDAATPSPIKRFAPQLTLMERTRLTMGGSHSPSPSKPTVSEPSPVPEEDDAAAAERERQASLIERTRQSMLLMADLPKQPAPLPRKHSNNAKRKSRGSLFPSNPWESARKVSPLFEEWAAQQAEEEEGGGGGRATPKESLFESDADYESVFKSRPKIAASPLMTPHGDESGVDGVSELEMEMEMEEGEGTGEDDDESDFASSPLRGRGR